MTKTIILGGGITGLSSAYFLNKYQPNEEVILLEKNSYIGGLLQGHSREFFFEPAARAFIPSEKGLLFLEMAKDLGLESSMITAKTNKRLIYSQGMLKEVPKDFKGVLIQAFLKDIVAKRGRDSETVYSFAKRRFGKHCAEILIDALTHGIYGRSCKELSLEACFPKMKQLEEKYRSLSFKFFSLNKKKSPLMSFQGGFITLLNALENKLKHIIIKNAIVNRINFKNRIEIILSDGRTMKADRLVTTVNPLVLKEMFPEPYNHYFNGLEMSPMHWVNLAFKKEIDLPQAFGYLVPTIERQPILGCVFDSQIFKQHNRFSKETRLTFMSQSALDEKVICQLLKEHLNISLYPDAFYFGYEKDAIPYFTESFLQKRKEVINKFTQSVPEITLLGTAFKGAGVTDCIEAGYNVAV